MSDKLEKCFGFQATDTSHIQAQFRVVDKTDHLLRSIAGSNEEDRLEWEAIAQAFFAVLFAVQEHLKTQTLRPSLIFGRQCETVRTGAPGRPPFYIRAETWEDLRGIGFSWKNIAVFWGSTLIKLLRTLLLCTRNPSDLE